MNMQEKHIVMFREDLPKECPPIDANLEEEFLIMRMAKTDEPAQECFHSKAALQLPVGDSDPCEFASCSFFRANDESNFIESIRKLPSFKKHYSHVFFLKTSKLIGKYKLNIKSKHVHVWFYAEFDPVASISDVRPI